MTVKKKPEEKPKAPAKRKPRAPTVIREGHEVYALETGPGWQGLPHHVGHATTYDGAKRATKHRGYRVLAKATSETAIGLAIGVPSPLLVWVVKVAPRKIATRR